MPGSADLIRGPGQDVQQPALGQPLVTSLPTQISCMAFFDRLGTGQVLVGTSSASSAHTRVLMLSRMRRTSSMPLPAGSGSSQSR